jgi:hypothetical protein
MDSDANVTESIITQYSQEKAEDVKGVLLVLKTDTVKALGC